MSRNTRSKRPEPAAAAAPPPAPSRAAESNSPSRLASPLVAAALAAATATPPAAAAAAATEPPAHVRKYVGDARLATGRLTWFGFHVYDAALFAPPGFDLKQADAQPFVLELTYARRLSGKSIAEASRDEIARLGFGTEAQRARWFEAMLRLFPDVTKGQRLAGVHLPGTGARFYFNGQFLGSVDDPQFAQAFFAIWLDERTRAPQLRESLLKDLPPLRSAGL
jgi:hypothetical protein